MIYRPIRPHEFLKHSSGGEGTGRSRHRAGQERTQCPPDDTKSPLSHLVSSVRSASLRRIALDL